ncbi:hypothetical protein GPS50_13530 [Acinetobacter haemolyticus]|uniref:hypothetical protein n=1 Tax=Acinetobacter haemolyticus TaxID=29430 RepID=UPI000E590C5F|nr:hypothetical protein [Acinetobacter haemolyticus]NAR58284.1 hypothetical protein [Acinetobacter haemolyticus]NAR80714.1 hypothetical protein [Acinetobacter haemolyticus]NAR90682.1 hypothetical protein [Acinetobacter haemolyticus]NAR96843.1 hypothetical protein [Acinetobacter haemolyticus]QDJ91945.1 hypothetical protein AhaeAN54_007620 [Acinetobacter haemolyticus]
MNILSSLLLISITAITLTGCSSKAEREFVKGCKMGGADSSTCECVYEKIEDKYGTDRLEEKFYIISQTEEFQNEIVQYGMQCMKE